MHPHVAKNTYLDFVRRETAFRGLRLCLGLLLVTFCIGMALFMGYAPAAGIILFVIATVALLFCRLLIDIADLLLHERTARVSPWPAPSQFATDSEAAGTNGQETAEARQEEADVPGV